MIDVSLDQFYGIEINDFAVAVAKTALWIAEIQKKKETEEIVGRSIPPLPLKSYENIIEGNALRVDWDSIVPKDKLSYIMGIIWMINYYVLYVLIVALAIDRLIVKHHEYI